MIDHAPDIASMSWIEAVFAEGWMILLACEENVRVN